MATSKIEKAKDKVSSNFLNGNSSVQIAFSERIFVTGVYSSADGFALIARDGNVFFLNSHADITATASGGILTITCSSGRGFRLLVVTV